MQLEIWKEISGFEGFYEVSNLGNVRSLPRTVKTSNGKLYNYKGRLLKPFARKGYLSVNLQKDGVRKVVNVHRLVANEFIRCGDVVNHLDGNKKNNNLKNLEVTTQKENVRHYLKMKLKKSFNNQHTKQKDV